MPTTVSNAFYRPAGLTLAGLILLFCLTSGIQAQERPYTETVLIHPPIETTADGQSLAIREHTYREQLQLGDQLASDFSLKQIGDDGISRIYRPGTDGKANEDWYGWRAPVLAPFDANVTRVEHPDAVNEPGVMNRDAQPGLIFFESKSGITVLYAHVREITVEEGDSVTAGEKVALVGNNGNSRGPHVHAGAWKDETPLQIQVDLYAAHR
ncbi:MAG: M23 family metallopeptidase [Pseudomonadota bacterium]